MRSIEDDTIFTKFADDDSTLENSLQKPYFGCTNIFSRLALHQLQDAYDWAHIRTIKAVTHVQFGVSFTPDCVGKNSILHKNPRSQSILWDFVLMFPVHT